MYKSDSGEGLFPRRKDVMKMSVQIWSHSRPFLPSRWRIRAEKVAINFSKELELKKEMAFEIDAKSEAKHDKTFQ